MAVYYAVGFEIDSGLHENFSDVSSKWQTIKPTYLTNPGMSSAIDISDLQPVQHLYRDSSNGKTYVVCPWDMSVYGDITSNSYIGNYQEWAHNDTSSYANPNDYTVNVSHLKDVYIANVRSTTEMFECDSYGELPVYRFDSYWNLWRNSKYIGSYHNKSTSAYYFPYNYNDMIFDTKSRIVAVKTYENSNYTYDFNYPGTSGVTIVRIRYGQTELPYHEGFRVGLVPSTYTSFSQSYTGTYSNNIYSFDRKSRTSAGTPSQNSAGYAYTVSTSFRDRIFAIHNNGNNPKYNIGFWGTGSGSSTSITNPAYGGYRYVNGGYDTWVSMDGNAVDVSKCYAITVDGTSKFIKQEIPVQLGKKYTFTVWGDGRLNYDGVVLGKAELSAGSYSSTLATNFGSSNANVIDYVSFNKNVAVTCGVTHYTPTEDGTVYMYLRKSTDATTSNQTYANKTFGSVGVLIEDAPAVTVTLNKNSGSGGTNSVSIAPGTAAANYPTITLPTRSGYIFQGYYDDQTGGTAYYNAAGYGTKVFDKVSAVTLYAHWQQESIETIVVTLNQNGGTGGQSQVAIPKNATTSQYPSIQIPTRVGLSSSSPAFSFLGYWDGINHTSSTQYIGENGQGLRTFNKTSACTFYAGWKNNIYVDFLDSVTVTFSPNSQSVKIANSTICSSDDAPAPGDGGIVGQNSVSCTFTDGGKYVTIPASVPVGTYTVSYHLISPSNVTGAEGYHGYNKLFQGCQLTIQKATPTFVLQGDSVASGSTAQAKVNASVPGTVYWGTSSSSMTNTMSITSSQAGLLVNLTNATNSTSGTTVTIYAYFVPTDTTNYSNTSTTSATLVVAAPTTSTIVITLNDNGGSGGSGSIVVEKNSSCSFWPSVSVPTRTGFTFMGYYTVSTVTGGSQVYYESGRSYYGYSSSSDVTIYARWKVNITFYHNHKNSDTAIETFVSMNPGEATSTTSAITLPIDGSIGCVISTRTVTVTSSDKTSWTINSTGTQLTIPSGTSYSSGSLNWQIVVANGTYNNYPYVGNTLESYYFDTTYRSNIYYNLKKVEYEKKASYPYNAIKYKDMNGTLGYNVTNAVTPGDGNTINGPYYHAYTVEKNHISNSLTNDISWYQKYTNGTWDTTPKTGSESVYAVWRIISETFTPANGGSVQNITRSHASDTAVASQLLINGNYYTVYRAYYSDYNFVHESMEDNLGTDNLVVRIYNPSDPTKYTDITDSAKNNLISQHYSDTNGTEGNITINYGNPEITIVPDRTTRVEPFTPGSTTYASVYCSSINEGTWYQKYSSGYYSLFSGTIDGSTKWRISSQTCVGGTNRFDIYYGTSSSITIDGTSYVVYNNGNEIKHSSMTTNAGDDTVAVIAYNVDDLSKTSTSSITVTNGYTDTYDKITSYGTPVVTIGSGFTASNGSAIVTCTVTNSVRISRKYDSDSTSSYTSASPGVAKWKIDTNGSNRFTASGTSSMFSGLTVYNDGDSIAHSTMGTWEGTDTVVVRAYNASSTKTNLSSTDTVSVTNSIVSEGNPTIVSYGTPIVTIGTGITAAGGSATVTCSVSNTQRIVRTYTTGATSNVDTSVSGTAKWKVTVNGSSRFTASGTSSTLNGVGTVYNTGGKVNHSSMLSYVGTDSVTVTAYNTGSPTETATSTKSVTNALTSIAITLGSNTIDYNGTTSMTVKASYTSGLSTHDVTSAASISTSPSNIITITI